MDWNALVQAIEAAGGPALTLISAHPVGGGDIHEAWRLHCEEGDYFLKTNRPASLPMFRSEAHALAVIYATHTIRCPKPYAVGEGGGKAFLLMEYLPLGARGNERDRGRALALMHHHLSDNGCFGWDEDNYIGHTLQPNGWDTDWVHFYGEKRLRHQLKLAQAAGGGPRLFEKGEKLIEAQPAFFSTYTPKPSLLHGDLWGGNSAFTEDGEPVIYDPASYYGDHEADIAMTELFGGFGRDFYAAYREVFPLDEGYRVRRELYNLYHLLNHFNLFGGGYARSAERTIDALLAEVL
ncbi:Fructosamine-3-kinase [Sulfurivirga caldicuralii]|uniref:Fructosamine-3-kinase n=1 Tax=Sulfurivirga caldicuralii TaxID=364032 RepID=A0A1N6DG96_9GAMM|nr:fructosamine kinase family protein [Sulfurivirga caldicuralii]SIN69756.1 Fructosamine-3-kinase [Sulfurivirga caldicuralii]